MAKSLSVSPEKSRAASSGFFEAAGISRYEYHEVIKTICRRKPACTPRLRGIRHEAGTTRPGGPPPVLPPPHPPFKASSGAPLLDHRRISLSRSNLRAARRFEVDGKLRRCSSSRKSHTGIGDASP